MPPHSTHLDGVRAKINRADEHLRSLQEDIKKYLDTCGENASVLTQVYSGGNALIVEFGRMPAPDLRISVIIGDCVHNMRSSLDHLWKRLDGKGKFPLYGEREGDVNWQSQRTKKLDGVVVRAHAIIDGLQPCLARQDAPFHPLSILNNLANTDKHDTIHLTKPRSYVAFAFVDKDTGQTVRFRYPIVIRFDTKTSCMAQP